MCVNCAPSTGSKTPPRERAHLNIGASDLQDATSAEKTSPIALPSSPEMVDHYSAIWQRQLRRPLPYLDRVARIDVGAQ